MKRYELRLLRKMPLDQCWHMVRRMKVGDHISADQIIAVQKVLFRNRLLEHKLLSTYNLVKRLGKIL